MLRAFLAWWTGRPRCDHGTAVGSGCWRAAAWQTKPPLPVRWTRPLRFCDRHGGPNRAWYVPIDPKETT